MRVSASVDITTFIEDGSIEVNPIYMFQSAEDLNEIVDNRLKNNNGRGYIYLPDSVFNRSLNLLEYLEIWGFEASKLLRFSKNPNATDFESLRIYCESEFLEYISVVDLKYKNCDGVYKLSEIRLWDEIPTIETFTYDFKLQAVDSKVLDTIELKLDLFERKLEHKTTVKSGQNEHTIEYL